MRRTRFTPAATAAALVSLLCLAAAAPAQNLTTDRDDYLPGETVYFAGTGFQPGELVSIALQVEDYSEQVLDYAIGGIAVDAAGEFTATWLVPQEALNTLITATAVGLTSGKVASTRFLDSHVQAITATEFSAAGDTVTVEVTLPHWAGFYYQKTAMVAHLEAPGVIDIPVPLTAVSTQYDIHCCGPNFGGGVVVFRGTAELSCETTYTLRRVTGVRALGVFGGCGVFSTGALATWPLAYFDSHTFLRVIVPAPTATTGACGGTCPTNAAPALQLEDIDLGRLVGCLRNGTLEKDVTVSAADFMASAIDEDGDPVSIAFHGPTSFTFVGPGVVSGTVSFTATDDPSARETAGCPLAAESVTRTATVVAHIVYDFDGPHAPMTAGETLIKKVGRTIPLKFTLRDCNGTEVAASNSGLFNTAGDIPELGVTAVTMMAPGGDPVVGDPGTSNDNGTLFRYSGTTGVDGQWIYNLSTKEPGWTAGVLYRADVMLNDATTRSLYFTLTK